ncbi:MAG: flagellar filament capping protein FliD [Hydrogenophaga sp.]|uniref:flagellar filament capping protein FliD n=1 Tax=Hydrogenophaga sp. TaxID=1904254 RepID=UPI0025C0A073|nr:flagellar filament capping protein FliD [Hydrogenophaga sp.]MBU7572413.1 flagellar filament capping protein FliD [Hydrogenophaga sp.]
MDINPTQMATQLATIYTQGTQDIITRDSKSADATNAGYTRLRSALSAFNTAMDALSGKKGLVKNSVSFAGSSGATGTASASAQPGTYSFFVEAVASNHQIAFADLPAVPVATGGPLVIQQADGSSFNVNLLMADADGNGTISQTEIARAINQASGNAGKVTAQVVNTGNGSQLILSSGASGEDGAITVDASGLPAGALKNALSATPNELAQARDAVVWLGDQGTGVRIQQASNTVTAIDGVTLSLTRAMSTGDAPATLTVAADEAGTADNVRSFVTAFNTLQGVINDLTKTDINAAARGVFASDSSVRALRTRLNDILRQDFGGVRMSELGISTDRQGALTFDAAKLKKTLDVKPDALDKAFGSSSLSAPSGVLGSMNTYLKTWLDSGNGQIKRRQDSVQTLQRDITHRQARLDEQFAMSYERYLLQFTQLQSLMGQLNQTSGMFGSSTSATA